MAKPLYVYTGSDWVPVASELESTSQYLPIQQAQASFRNLIINGAMQVAQRGTSTASITTAGYYAADRWRAAINSAGTWTQSVENDGPTGSGFRKSSKMLCTTSTASPTLAIFAQRFEGQNLQSIRKGTSDAQQLTLSFWVKSNVTGTYVVELDDVDNNPFYVSSSYTINSSATWEKKTITFPADTTGTFDNDNNNSLSLNFWLAANSTFSGGSTLQTTWGSTVNERAVGQENLAAATNNYWQITGVQLEVGAVATPFEFKDYGTELAECQRYYYRVSVDSSVAYSCFGSGFVLGSAAAYYSIPNPVLMRAPAHTLGTSAGNTFYVDTGSGSGQATSIVLQARHNGLTHELGVGKSGLTSGQGALLLQYSNNAAYIEVSSEL